MADYEIQFEGMVPEWNSVIVEGAADAVDAEALAFDQISLSYPEMDDVNIVSVKEIIK